MFQRVSLTVLILVLCSSCFVAGGACGLLFGTEATKRDSVINNPLTVAMQNLKPGDSITMEDYTGPTGHFDTSTYTLGRRAFGRFASWFGCGGPEAVVKSGTLPTEEGNKSSWLDSAWETVKSIFWVAVALVVIYLICSILSFVHPAFGVIAKIMAGICTLGLSLIMAIPDWIAKLRATKALKETTAGVEKGREHLTEEQDKLFMAELVKAQKSERATVDAVRP